MKEIKDFLEKNKSKEIYKNKLKEMISNDNALFKKDDKDQLFDYLYDQNPTLASTIALTSFISDDAVKPLLKAFESDVELYQVPHSRMLRGFGYQPVLDNTFFIDIKEHGYLAITDNKDVFFCSALQDKIQHLNYYLTDTEIQSFIDDVKYHGERLEVVEPFLSRDLIKNAHIVRTEMIKPELVSLVDEEHRIEINLYLPFFPNPNLRLEVELIGSQSEHTALYRADNIKAFGFTSDEMNQFVELVNESHDEIIDKVVEELKTELFDDLQRYTIDDLSLMKFKLVDHVVEERGYADTSTRKAGLFLDDELAISLLFSGEVELEQDEDLVMFMNSTDFVVENPYRLGLTNKEAIKVISEKFSSNIKKMTLENDRDLNDIENKRIQKGFKKHH
ncbi:hypothetical protein CO725_00880 [Vibrio parahaemolyticus]|uniref:hypothetical protein n=1 Tax=Vibrio parahaemolyticus TaxID=670 RepID=UPI000BE41BC8|nr:hypothetical protein [Vibrio parahaemolyticus]ATI44240.1 hypothetical protein CO725_00880 [Vibrio parahaemolyticus]